MTPDLRRKGEETVQQIVYDRYAWQQRWIEAVSVLRLDPHTTTQAEFIEILQTLYDFTQDE